MAHPPCGCGRRHRSWLAAARCQLGRRDVIDTQPEGGWAVVVRCRRTRDCRVDYGEVFLCATEADALALARLECGGLCQPKNHKIALVYCPDCPEGIEEFDV